MFYTVVVKMLYHRIPEQTVYVILLYPNTQLEENTSSSVIVSRYTYHYNTFLQIPWKETFLICPFDVYTKRSSLLTLGLT